MDNNTEQGVNSPLSVPATSVLKQDGENDSLDTIFAALKNQRRRYIMYYLHQQGDIAVDELVELIAASENGGDRAAVTDDEQKEVEIGLIHTHLPKLVEADIIIYDKTKRRVCLEEDISHLRSHLDEAAKDEFQ